MLGYVCARSVFRLGLDLGLGLGLGLGSGWVCVRFRLGLHSEPHIRHVIDTLCTGHTSNISSWQCIKVPDQQTLLCSPVY